MSLVGAPTRGARTIADLGCQISLEEHEVSFPLDLFQLDGRVALITGGGGGLGTVFARALAGAGADIALLGRRAETAQAAADQVAEATGRRTLAVAADVTNPEQVRA